MSNQNFFLNQFCQQLVVMQVDYLKKHLCEIITNWYVYLHFRMLLVRASMWLYVWQSSVDSSTIFLLIRLNQSDYFFIAVITFSVLLALRRNKIKLSQSWDSLQLDVH